MELVITKNNGEIVSHSYLKQRVASHLGLLRRSYTLDERRAAIAETVENDAWLSARNGQTVGSICRDVFKHI